MQKYSHDDTTMSLDALTLFNMIVCSPMSGNVKLSTERYSRAFPTLMNDECETRIANEFIIYLISSVVNCGFLSITNYIQKKMFAGSLPFWGEGDKYF